MTRILFFKKSPPTKAVEVVDKRNLLALQRLLDQRERAAEKDFAAYRRRQVLSARENAPARRAGRRP